MCCCSRGDMKLYFDVTHVLPAETLHAFTRWSHAGCAIPRRCASRSSVMKALDTSRVWRGTTPMTGWCHQAGSQRVSWPIWPTTSHSQGCARRTRDGEHARDTGDTAVCRYQGSVPQFRRPGILISLEAELLTIRRSAERGGTGAVGSCLSLVAVSSEFSGSSQSRHEERTTACTACRVGSMSRMV
jgi:hypothetical protein